MKNYYFCILVLAIILVVTNISDSVILYSVIAITLLILSVWNIFFWLIVVPALVCFVSIETSVLLDRELALTSPLNHTVFGDLWILCVFIKAASFCYQQRALLIEKNYFLVGLLMLTTLLIGSTFFASKYVGLPFVNREPLKIILYIFFTGIVFSGVKTSGSLELIWRGFCAAAIVGVFQRAFIALSFSVKDPGIYTYTGVFVCFASIYFILDNKLPILKKVVPLFAWSVILLMHITPSRTEIILFVLSLIFFIWALKRNSVYIIAPFFVALFLISLYVPIETQLYFFHKLNFFLALIDGSYIGDSASVRVTEMRNLLIGRDSSIENIVFGRGFTGFIEFSEHPDQSVFSDSTFSNIQYELGKFYQLHFFVTEMLFFFGLLGVFAAGLIVARVIFTSVSTIEYIFLSYIMLNVMYRLELIFIAGLLISAFRHTNELRQQGVIWSGLKVLRAT